MTLPSNTAYVVILTTGAVRESLVLVISTAVMMLNGIHCTVSDLKSAIAFRLALVVVGTSLQDMLVHLSPAGGPSSNRVTCGHQSLTAWSQACVSRPSSE